MGQTLSQPITTKEITMCQSSEYDVAGCAMQGWRVSMEDAHIHLLESPSDETAAFFAVYDGHGGAGSAQYAGIHLHKKIIGNEQYMKNDFHGAIQTGFLTFDEDLKQDQKAKKDMSGTTAVVVLIKNRTIFCGNAGDSRAVLCQQGKAVPLSFDHKPTDPEEMKRILAAGGRVDECRVNGNLALSRALGDFLYKCDETLTPEKQIVTAFPDVVEIQLNDEHEFILIACDGIWDVLSSEQAIAFCRKRLSEGYPPDQVCEELVDYCLAPDCELTGLGCDNMTVVLVCLLQGLSKEEYLARLKRKSLSTMDMDCNESPFTAYTLQSNKTISAYLSAPDDEDDQAQFTEETKPATDNFITPSESPHHEELDNDMPPVQFEVIVPEKSDK